jgi:putative transposase
MVTFLAVIVRLVEDALRWLVSLCRSTKSLEAENLFLRRQLAIYIERGVRPVLRKNCVCGSCSAPIMTAVAP